MANAWFRMYSEFAYDPKVQILNETLQRRYIMFLCVTCSGDATKRSEIELAFLFRLSLEEFRSTVKSLIDHELLDEDGQVKNWAKRQYISDSSTERVKRHRAKKSETLHETDETKGNVTVTPPDTDTDTDTEEDGAAPANKSESVFLEMFKKKEASLRRLFPQHNFEVVKETCVEHYRCKPPVLDPYERALKWFQREQIRPPSFDNPPDPDAAKAREREEYLAPLRAQGYDV